MCECVCERVGRCRCALSADWAYAVRAEQSSSVSVCAHLSHGGCGDVDVSVLSLLHAVVNAFVSFDVCVCVMGSEMREMLLLQKNALPYPLSTCPPSTTSSTAGSALCVRVCE